MLLDGGGGSAQAKPKPQQQAAPVQQPARSAEPAPRAAVAEARQGVNDLYRVLSFGPPKFDPAAVPDARSQLEEALKAPYMSSPLQGSLQDRGPGPLQPQHGEPHAGPLQSGNKITDHTPFDQGATLAEHQQGVDSAQAALEEALRNRREHAIGNDGLDFTGNRDKVKPLTTEQYEALDPRQRQAIDFNTMLVQAVKRDLNHQDDYEHSSEEQRAKYAKDVKSIFGEDRGSEQYSPETVALLKRIGFDDPSADLDDFLSLKSAIHARDVKQMAGPEPTILDAMKPNPAAQDDSARTDRLNLSQMLAAKTGQLQTQLAKGTELLQSMQASATNDRAGLVASYGGTPRQVAPASGFGGTDRDRYFQSAFDTMARSDADVKRALAVLNQNHPEDYQDFLAYAANRLGNAETYGLALGGEDGVTYRTPEQIRKELGLDEGG